jgi:hypothetical protein
MIDIVKLDNGNVAIYDTTSGDFIRSLSPDIVEIDCNENGIVKVKQENGSVEYFDPALVTSTQVVPAAAVPFSGNCVDLSELLSTDFFFVVSGGGAVDAASVTYDNSTSGLVATDVQAAIDEVVDSNLFTRRASIGHNFNYNGTPSGIVQVNDQNFLVYGFEMHGEQNISNLTIEVTNASAAGTKFVIGIYKNNGNGLPGSKVVQTTEFSGDLVAVQTYNFASPVNLKPGLYFYCIMSNAGNMYCRALQSVDALPVFGYSSTTTAPLCRGLMSAPYAYNATMPATAPTIDTFANANLPFILLTTSNV